MSGIEPRPRRPPLDRLDLLIVGAVAIVYLAVGLAPFGVKPFADEDFHLEAKLWSGALRGDLSWGELALKRAPVPSLYYTLPYLLIRAGSPENHYWIAAVIWNAIWTTMAVLLIRRAAEHLGGPMAGKLGAAAVLLSPFFAYYSYGINAESAAYLALAIFSYGWAVWRVDSQERRRQRGGRLAIFGMALFLLTRPNAMLLIPLAFSAAFFAWRRHSEDGQRQARFAFQAAAIAVVAVMAVSTFARNLHGRALDRSQSGYFAKILFQSRYQFRNEPFDWRFFHLPKRPDSQDMKDFLDAETAFKMEAQATGIPQEKLEFRWAISDMLAHPLITLRQAAVRLMFAQVVTVGSVPRDQFRLGPLRGTSGYLVFHSAVNFVHVGLLLLAIGYIARRARSALDWWPLWAPFIAIATFHTLVYVEPRYLFPARVGITIAAALAIADFLQRRRSARSQPPPAATSV